MDTKNVNKYYGYSKEQVDRILFLLDKISVTGFTQVDSFAEATKILRQPKEISVEEEKKEGDKNVV